MQNRIPGPATTIFQRVPPWLADIFFLSALVAFNPVWDFWGLVRTNFTPDAVSYASLAQGMINNGSLVLDGWGSAHASLILPPFFPAVIAGFFLANQDILFSVFASSFLAGLLAPAALYFFCRKISDRPTAFVCALFAQVHFSLLYMATTPLTESLFVAVLGLVLVTGARVLARPGQGVNLALFGAACALAALTRQVGLYLIGLAAVFVLFQSLGLGEGRSRKGFRPGPAAKDLALLTGGWAALFVPYALVIFLQAGALPLSQVVRLPAEGPSAQDTAVARELARLMPEQDEAYSSVIAKRRQLNRLLPDASAMYADLQGLVGGQGEEAGVATPMDGAARALGSPGILAGRFVKNLKTLQEQMGGFLFFAFWAACLTPFAVFRRGEGFLARMLIPALCVSYLAAISLFTAEIPRYVTIVIPFALAQAGVEARNTALALLSRAPVGPATVKSLALLACAIFCMGGYLAEREDVSEYKSAFKPRSVFGENYGQFMSFPALVNGGAVFSFHPSWALLSGGRYRVMPNDSLERINQYAAKTGVKWMIVGRGPLAKKEYGLNKNIQPWYGLLVNRTPPAGARLAAVSPDGNFFLYKLGE